MKIAEKMGEIHSLDIPMSKEPNWLWNCMNRWLKSVAIILKQNNWKNNEKQAQCVREFDFNAESQWLKSMIDKGNYKVFFCHNDLQEGNILFRETDVTSNPTPRSSLNETRPDSSSLNLSDTINANIEDSAKFLHNSSISSSDSLLNCTSEDDLDLIIIDFEYCAYNYRGFDLANHFLEWTFDYSNPAFPFYFHHIHQYPNEEQRNNFIITYLKKLNESDLAYIPTANEVKDVQDEVRLFTLFSHLFWILWSVVNVTSNIEFGYWEYAETRLGEYKKLKEELVRCLKSECP
ncbi:choline/ethanolamine kinase-like [Teleopsis dalmanni]|nr:choline/ethanolamine kinase-like [Teleopsis dalmanni]